MALSRRLPSERVPVLDDAGLFARSWFLALLGISGTVAPAAPSQILVTGSPFVFQNADTMSAVLVTGGTVSLIEFSRDGTTWYDLGAVAGLFDLSAKDRLRVTYTVAPAMTLIPR